MAISLPPHMSHDLYEALIKHDHFINCVRALTGRTDDRAKLLLRRINKIAEASLFDSTDALMTEWKRRTMMGWGSQDVRNRVKVKKLARAAFGKQ